MAKYFEVKNNGGSITIDDTNARLVKTRTITFHDDSPQTVPSADVYYLRGYIPDQYVLGGYASQFVDLQDNESFVAVRTVRTSVKRENVAVLGGFVSPTRYMITLLSNWSDKDTHMSDFLIDVYGTVPNGSTNGNVGLQVFNANGKKIFDNNYYTMDVAGMYSVLDKNMESFVNSVNTYNIGNYSRKNYAVAVNTSINKPYRHPHTGGQLWASVLYGVVFGDTIYLEKRVCTYLQFLYSGGTYTPHGMSHSASGLILDTTNIS